MTSSGLSLWRLIVEDRAVDSDAFRWGLSLFSFCRKIGLGRSFKTLWVFFLVLMLIGTAIERQAAYLTSIHKKLGQGQPSEAGGLNMWEDVIGRSTVP